MKLKSMMVGAAALFLGQAPQSAAQDVEPPHGWSDMLTIGACSKDNVPVDFEYKIWTKFNDTATKDQERKVLSDAFEPLQMDLARALNTAMGKVYANELAVGERISDEFLAKSFDPAVEASLRRYVMHAERIMNQEITLYTEVGVVVGKSTDEKLPCNRKPRMEPPI